MVLSKYSLVSCYLSVKFQLVLSYLVNLVSPFRFYIVVYVYAHRPNS